MQAYLSSVHVSFLYKSSHSFQPRNKNELLMLINLFLLLLIVIKDNILDFSY